MVDIYMFSNLDYSAKIDKFKNSFTKIKKNDYKTRTLIPKKWCKATFSL